ncbi:hypothetical protein [Bacteriovorax sp. DB6_IX]|uniref:hypothetical protein n=1 Tax=Bacteriovorax sp. DB6_IX TaxID=1353530 RepID=UPI00038A2C43|nr:hypothetical protein [Bacteriovorax sp. DB6_IX]EQC50762.1 hypothetical protein M901_2967 [Bacteriovorax sp. DB6_IX]
MSEYITEPFEDKGKYQVLPSAGRAFSIIFDNKSEAHKFSISLMLGAAPSPSQSPDFYTELKTENGTRYLEVAPLKKVEEEAGFDISECCQSGCSGCPYYGQ